MTLYEQDSRFPKPAGWADDLPPDLVVEVTGPIASGKSSLISMLLEFLTRHGAVCRVEEGTREFPTDNHEELFSMDTAERNLKHCLPGRRVLIRGVQLPPREGLHSQGNRDV